MKAAIIGGGAAGFFLAIHLKRACPKRQVVIFEKASRTLAKVAISGGGRCNLTNSFAQIAHTEQAYPRGHRLMRRLLREFSQHDTQSWFEHHGVPLVEQEDCCVFPQAQDSAAITGCLQREARAAGVQVVCSCGIERVERTPEGLFRLVFRHAVRPDELFHQVAVTTGGAPHSEGYHWLSALGQPLLPPCPSLYTLSIAVPQLTALMGIVAPHAAVALAGTRLRAEGALLITHWGLSGPAVLRLSSYAARVLHEAHYQMTLLVAWSGTPHTEEVMATLQEIVATQPAKQMGNVHPFGLQTRLWHYLLQRCDLRPERPWAEAGRKALNRLANVLTADSYPIAGKGSYRDEFVTCGGVALSGISSQTMESKVCPGLYFAGEVLDIDGITGGFNLQAAWTTAYVAAQAMAKATEPSPLS